jgi:arylsulfatase A-like enzyme
MNAMNLKIDGLRSNVKIRKKLIRRSLCLLGLFCLVPFTYSASDSRPNILLILVDDLGYGDLSCMGSEDLQTPQLDRLSQAGMRFDQFYANCPVCSPTRAALLTGRYPDMVGVPGVIRTHQANSWGYLEPGIPVLPEVLKNAGYHTAIVGKWHLGLTSPNTPWERGFDLFHGFLGDMMDDYWTHRRHGYNYIYRNQNRYDPKGHATDLFTRWAVDYLVSRQNEKEPFFLYLAYNAPHTPIQPPESWVKNVKQRQPEISDKRAKLVALIEHMDQNIGLVLRTLQDTGLGRNTLVIFTSDNGGQVDVGASNGSLRGGKQQMYEGGIRVPCFVVWPDRITPNTRNARHVAMTMDLYSTLLEVAGVTPEAPVDGRSLLSLLRGTEDGWTERTLFWMRREGGRFGGRVYYAVRRGRYKLLQNGPLEPMRLFDLRLDPFEKSPLPSSHPMVRELTSELQKHINRSGAVPWAPNPVDIEAVYPGR